MKTSSLFPFRQTLRAVRVAVRCALVVGFAAHAEIVPDGGTNILSGTDSNLVGNLVVGSNSPFTLLVLTNGTGVTNSGTATVGDNSASDSNRVVITGAGTRWVVGSGFLLGRSGGNNVLEVRNGAVFSNASATIGLLSGGSGNLALVTGLNSLWTNSGTLTLGLLGDGNRLVVSNLGVVNAQDMTIGGTGGRSNEALITGACILQVADQLIVGEDDDGNRLTVTNGSSVRVGGALVLGANAGSTNNRITISSSTLRVTNAAGTATLDLRRGTNVFDSGTMDVDQLVMTNAAGVFEFNGGTLITRGGLISNGAPLLVNGTFASPAVWQLPGGGSNLWLADGAVIGATAGGGSNLVQFTGGHLIATNAGGTAVFEVRRGTNQLDSGVLDVDQLVMTNAAGVFDFNGGTLISRGGLISNGAPLLVNGTFASPAVWQLPGGGSNLWLADGAVIGATAGGGSNRVRFTGGHLIAANAAGTAIFEVLRGTNQLDSGVLDVDQLVMTNAAGVFEFNGGTLITRGGIISNGLPFIVGASGGVPAIWDVRDGPSNVVVATNLIVGLNVAGSRLFVTNGQTLRVRGGSLTRPSVVLGGNVDASNTLVVVAGAGSVLSNAGRFYVGSNAAFNTLVVSNGGVLLNLNAFLGFNASSSNNLAVVTGAGSFWRKVLAVGGDLTIGSSGPGNTLVVSNGGAVLGNTGTLGDVASSSNNLAVVTGSGSFWSNSFELIIGGSSDGNQLLVSGGGAVHSSSGTVGSGFADRNTVVVTGAGSLWTNSSSLTIGFIGSGNQLVVSNGGVVRNTTGTLGSSGSSNVAVVTGGGSTWSSTGALTIGSAGPGNQVLVSNSAALIAAGLVVGSGTNSTGNLLRIDNATVTVTNAGGTAVFDLRRGTNQLNSGTLTADQLVMTNNGDGVFEFNGGTLTTRGGVISNGTPFLVGGPGSAARLWQLLPGVSNHLAMDGVVLGPDPTGVSNRLLVSGGSLLVNNPAGTAALDLRRGTNQLDSGLVDADQLVMTNAAGAFQFNGGTLVTRGAILSNGAPFVVGASGGTPAIWDVRAGAGGVVLASNLVVGQNVADSQLLVTNGQTLQVNGGSSLVRSSALGLNAGASNTLALVSGAGSLWSNAFDLTVGSNASFNQLVISNGGRVVNSNATIGAGTAAANNSATVTGAGSVWDATGALVVGASGWSNALMVEAGGRVQAFQVSLATTTNSGGNTLIVRDAGSALVVSNRLAIGSSGGNNVFLITNGGMVTNLSFTQVGFSPASSSNLFVVTGLGSSFTAASSVNVGATGGANRMEVRDGATVAVNTTASTQIGSQFTAHGNALIISDPGSTMILTGAGATLSVGFAGSTNLLLVTNGGLLTTPGAEIGGFSNSTANLALVTGSGSMWSNSGSFAGNSDGFGNRLEARAGGQLNFTSLTWGGPATASNNVVLIEGAGSQLQLALGGVVGGNGSANQLIVSNGGTVFSAGNFTVGFSATSINNRLTVDGGTLRVTNAAGTALLNVRRGTNQLNAGTMDVDGLMLTNALSVFEFNGGTLRTKGTTNANGSAFSAGNGSSAATLQLAGGTHVFSNSLVIASNATLTGTGTIIGTVTNFGGLSPGSSPGALTINGGLSLKGSANLTFEIGGLIATNQYDVLTVTNFVQFAGTLSLSLLNNFLPAPVDSFTLISFGSSSGAFANATNGGRVSLTNNLASFAVTYSSTNLVIGGVQYVDGDGDGQGDLQEQLAGTDLNNPASYLHILSITVNGSGHYVIRFSSVGGKNYTVEYSDTLAAWTTIADAPFSNPAAGVLQFVDNGTLTGGLAVGARHYRIRLAP